MLLRHHGLADVAPEPDRRDHAESASNGWIHTFDANDMSGVNGKQVSAEGRSWTLSGTAVGGHAADSPQAFAKNLANSINADGGSQVSASAGGAVCNLARKSDPIQLHLISTSSRDLRMTSSESIIISEQHDGRARAPAEARVVLVHARHVAEEGGDRA